MFGSCSALALLTAIGCGEVTNLGTNHGPGGSGGSGADRVDGAGVGNATGGTSPNTGGRGGVEQAGGGSGGTPAGGGSGGTPAGGGHDGGQPAGGHDGGGRAGGEHGGDGGQGGETAPLPYPLNPTVPISADCSCADDTSVCNAAGECVPRCEPGGVCAAWRVDRGVLGTVTSNDTLYFIVAAQHDDLGNPLPGEAGQESLWRVHYPEPAPTKVALLGGARNVLLAHLSDTTYLQTPDNSLLAVKDDGSVVKHDLANDTRGISVSSDGVFTLAQDGTVSRLALAADGSFGASFDSVVPGDGVVEFDNLGIFAGDRLWRLYGLKLCSFELGNLQAAGHCLAAEYSDIFGATGSRVVARNFVTEGINEVDVDNQTTRALWHWDISRGFTGTMAAGFVTGWLTEYPDAGASMLVRFPTEGVAKNPEPLIAQAVVRAMVTTNTSNVANGGLDRVAVTSDAVYWTQSYDDYMGPGFSRYIFRAPLPQ